MVDGAALDGITNAPVRRPAGPKKDFGGRHIGPAGVAAKASSEMSRSTGCNRPGGYSQTSLPGQGTTVAGTPYSWRMAAASNRAATMKSVFGSWAGLPRRCWYQ